MSYLSDEVFKIIIENTPLFSIDVIVINDKGEILTGLRKNPPAKDYWFLPGGRVRKGETLNDAFSRITHDELGVSLDYSDALFLGVYDHIWDDSIYGESLSTHYINCPMLIEKKITDFDLSLDESQHRSSKWTKFEEFEDDLTIHPLSKLFIPKLIELNKELNKKLNK